MQKQNKIIWILLSIAIAIALVFSGLWYFKAVKDTLYLKVDEIDFDLTGSRFMVDGYKVGTLGQRSNASPFVYQIELDQHLHIPNESQFYLKKDDHARIIIDVVLKPSECIYKSGDTIVNVLIDNNLPSAILPNETESSASQLVESTEKKVIAKNNGQPKATTTAIEYRVQIIASKSQLTKNSTKFKGEKGVKEFPEDGWYKYYFGPFESLDSAKTFRNQLVDKGFKDAFIVAYQGNNRISISKGAK